MANISRAELNNIAAGYLRDRVNGNINPFHAGWYPGNTNAGLLGGFSGAPAESYPGNYANYHVEGANARQLAINLGNYYARIVRGRYGMIRTGYSDFTGDVARNIPLDVRGNPDYDMANNFYVTYRGWISGSNGYSFTNDKHHYYQNIIAGILGGAVPAANIMIQGWYAGFTLPEASYANVIDTRNGNLLGRVRFGVYSYSTGGGGDDSGGTSYNFYYRLFWQAYAPAPIGYGYFVVNDAAAGMAAHRQGTENQNNALGPLTGTVTYNSMASYYDYLWNVVNQRKEAFEADLTVCHNSYVAPPHSSRGRR